MKKLNAILAVVMNLFNNRVSPKKVAGKWVGGMIRNEGKRYPATPSRYMPHQGKQECARRVNALN